MSSALGTSYLGFLSEFRDSDSPWSCPWGDVHTVVDDIVPSLREILEADWSLLTISDEFIKDKYFEQIDELRMHLDTELCTILRCVTCLCLVMTICM